jgi:hypothetical protein
VPDGHSHGRRHGPCPTGARCRRFGYRASLLSPRWVTAAEARHPDIAYPVQRFASIGTHDEAGVVACGTPYPATWRLVLLCQSSQLEGTRYAKTSGQASGLRSRRRWRSGNVRRLRSAKHARGRKFPQQAEKGKSRDKVAKAAGTSARTMTKIRRSLRSRRTFPRNFGKR